MNNGVNKQSMLLQMIEINKKKFMQIRLSEAIVARNWQRQAVKIILVGGLLLLASWGKNATAKVITAELLIQEPKITKNLAGNFFQGYDTYEEDYHDYLEDLEEWREDKRKLDFKRKELERRRHERHNYPNDLNNRPLPNTDRY